MKHNAHLCMGHPPRILSLLLILALLGTLSACASPTFSTISLVAAETPPAMQEELSLERIRQLHFSDVTADKPYCDAVCYVSSCGLLQGTGSAAFLPEGLLTRGTLAAILQRMSGEDAPAYSGDFTDVAAGNRDSVAWVCAGGIMAGISPQRFAPNAPVTRAQLAVVLYRYAKYQGYSTGDAAVLPALRDSAEIPDYARTAFAWAMEMGLFHALLSDSYQPHIAVSRAQLAQVLVSFIAYSTGEPLAVSLAAVRRLPPASASRSNHAAIQAAVDASAKKYGAVGLQVAVVEDGRLTDSYVCGYATKNVLTANNTRVSIPMTAQHKIRVASLSKVLIGASALLLREEGSVSLDNSIGDYWGCRVQNPAYPAQPVTVRNLLSHCSSLVVAGDEVSRAYPNVKARITGSSGYRRVQPGALSGWAYNNYGFAVLGMTLELASGETIDAILNRRLLTPMNIDAAFESGRLHNPDLLATIYRHDGSVGRSLATQKALCQPPVPGQNGSYFAGGFTCSATDLGKFVALLAGDGNYEGLQLLSAESVKIMETKAPLGDGTYQCLPLRYRDKLYGRSGLYYHTGSAYGVYNLLSYDPLSGDGVVVLTSGASAAKDANGIYAVCGEITSAIYAYTAAQ